MAIWSICRPFGLFYCHLVYFTAIWSILLPFGLFSRFGKFYQEKSGNPASERSTCGRVGDVKEPVGLWPLLRVRLEQKIHRNLSTRRRRHVGKIFSADLHPIL
jgi:hypothetical protein